MAEKIRLKIDRKRLGDILDVDTYLAVVYDDDERAMVQTLANFVVGEDGHVLPYEDGRQKLGKLSMNEYKICREAFIKGAEEAVVPLASVTS